MLQPHLGGGRYPTSSFPVEPWGGGRGRGRQGQCIFQLGPLIDSACATHAADAPIRAELIEARPHLQLFLLSTRLLIVTPNREGPPTKVFHFRQRELSKQQQALHCFNSSLKSQVTARVFLQGPRGRPPLGCEQRRLPPLVVRSMFTSSKTEP